MKFRVIGDLHGLEKGEIIEPESIPCSPGTPCKSICKGDYGSYCIRKLLNDFDLKEIKYYDGQANLEEGDLALVKDIKPGTTKNDITFVSGMIGYKNKILTVIEAQNKYVKFDEGHTSMGYKFHKSWVKKIIRAKIHDYSWVTAEHYDARGIPRQETYEVVGTGYKLPDERHLDASPFNFNKDSLAYPGDDNLYNDTILRTDDGMLLFTRKSNLKLPNKD